MFQWAKSVFEAASRWFYQASYRGHEVNEPAIVIDDAPSLNPAPVTAERWDEAKWKFGREDVEQSGSFFFRGAILDELDTYFTYLRRMRNKDSDAYDLFSQVGIHLLPEPALAPTAPPSSWLAGDIPSFGAVSFAMNDVKRTDDAIYIKIAYFQKFGRMLPGVQVAPSSIFMVTYIIDDRHDKKMKSGFPVSFCCYLDKETGTFRLLRELHRPKGRIATWRYPYYFCEVNSDTNTRSNFKRSHAEAAHFLMCLISNFHEMSASALRVTVMKDGLTGTFGIDTKRTAYFFKDRIKVKSESGATRRIFHIVRAHERRSKTVKFHFRGLRDFRWNGYRIVISMPGLHHVDPMKFTAEAILSDRHKPGYAGMRLLGKKIHEAFAQVN